MKNSIVFSVVLSVVCLSTAAFGQDARKPEEQGGQNSARRPQAGNRAEMPGMMAQRMPLLFALDSDQDGSISASEIENASKALATLDKDGDGALSPEEIRPDFAAMARDGMRREGQPGANGAPGKEMMARMFEQRDVDKDGKLSGDEIPERMQQNLSRMDENGDAAIDKSEMDKAMAKMGDRAGQVRGSKGDKDGAGVKPKRPSAD
jgi:Ca2+-binding EF-hand superfamily protein